MMWSEEEKRIIKANRGKVCEESWWEWVRVFEVKKFLTLIHILSLVFCLRAKLSLLTISNYLWKQCERTFMVSFSGPIVTFALGIYIITELIGWRESTHCFKRTLTNALGSIYLPSCVNWKSFLRMVEWFFMNIHRT